MTRIALAVAIAALALPAAAQAFDPIEGTWNYSGGAVLVEATGPGTFKGTVTKVTQFANCPHPVGQQIWAITSAPPDYSGTHAWYTSSCAVSPGGKSAWHVTTQNGGPVLIFCSNEPGSANQPGFDASGNPVNVDRGPSDCNTLTRLAPPQPPPTFAQAVQLPSTRKCRSRRSFRIHVRQKGDPFVDAVIKVNGKVVKHIIGVEKVSAPVNLRGLPKGRYTVQINLTTVTGKKVSGKRKYRTCTPKRHH